jgi:formylglycine-generating enzyme required for sulfatase activity
MNKTTAIKWVMGCLMGIFTLNVVADVTIGDVVARQRWPWSRLVDIDYEVIGDPSQRIDVNLIAKDGSTTLALPMNSLTGDLYNVAPGQKRIVWDPAKTTYTNSLRLTQFNVTLAPLASPLYMIIDLTKDAGAAGQIEYVTEADLTNNVYGAWVRNPVTNAGTVVESVIWTGVTNNTVYKTDKLVLRRVPAGSYQYGDGAGVNKTISNDMYVAVFETTQKQWNLVMGTAGGTDTQAKHSVSYYNIRENPANSDDPAVDWPSNTAVNATSFVGKLRTKTGIPEFDLPTEAQWEYFCRAKTTTVFNDGNTAAKYTGTEVSNNGTTNQYLNVLGWYGYNSPTKPPYAQTVGGKLPNAWGLYDTHGNVWEWCLDWYTTGSTRIFRGGGWTDLASSCRSASRNNIAPSTANNIVIGFRIVRTLP